MTPLKVLKDARKLLVEKGWTQGTFARTADGSPMNMQHLLTGEAACFCAAGAVLAAGLLLPSGNVDEQLTKPVYGYLGAAIRTQTLCSYGIDTFNDLRGTTAADVLSVFDRAIAMAAEEADE